MDTTINHAPEGLAQALFDSRSDAILATDREGLITFWNAGAERIFGFSPAQALGQSLDIIIPENMRGRHWQGWNHTLETGTSRYGAGDLLSVPALTADGRRISVEFTIAMIHDETQTIIGMAAILRDVTVRFEELKALRRQLAEAKAGG